MIKKLIELLTTKFGVGAKVVEGIAEKLSKTVSNEEEAATAVEGVSFQQVLESYADKRANEASETARKNAIKSYEEKYGLKDGKSREEGPKNEPTVAKTEDGEDTKPQPSPVPSPKEDKEVPEYVKALQEQLNAQQTANNKLLETLQAMQGEIKGMKVAKLTEDRQTRLNNEIAKLSDAQRKPYARIALDSMSDEEFDIFIEETRADVATIEKDNAAAAAAAGASRPFVGTVPVNGKKASDAELNDVVGKIL